MRACVYARVSTDEQTRGYSIGDQIAACRRVAESRGWSVVEQFLDEGESGGKFETRTAWRGLMAAAESRRFDVLVCDRIDRFSRATVLDALTTLEALRKVGVSFVTASEPFDLSHPAGEMMLLMLLALARQYLVNLSRVVTRGRHSRAQSGRSNANRPPFGYRRIDGRDVVHDPEREAVRQMFEHAASPAWSVTRIAQWLNDAGWRSVAGTRFARSGVAEMLRNQFYVGRVAYRGVREALADTKRRKRSETQWMPGQHEAIVTADEFARAQDGLARRRTGQFRRSEKAVDFYALRGMLVCSECDRLLFGSRTRHGKARYMCASILRGEVCAASHVSVREDALMPQIDAALDRLSISRDLLRMAEDAAVLAIGQAPNEDRRAEIQREQQRLDVMFRRGRVDQAQYERDMDTLDSELARLSDIVPHTVAQVADEFGTMMDVWRTAKSAGVKRDILAALAKSITVDVRAGVVVGWQPADDFRVLFESAGVKTATA